MAQGFKDEYALSIKRIEPYGDCGMIGLRSRPLAYQPAKDGFALPLDYISSLDTVSF